MEPSNIRSELGVGSMFILSKFVFETGGQIKFDVNLKDKFYLVNTPQFK